MVRKVKKEIRQGRQVISTEEEANSTSGIMPRVNYTVESTESTESTEQSRFRRCTRDTDIIEGPWSPAR